MAREQMLCPTESRRFPTSLRRRAAMTSVSPTADFEMTRLGWSCVPGGQSRPASSKFDRSGCIREHRREAADATRRLYRIGAGPTESEPYECRNTAASLIIGAGVNQGPQSFMGHPSITVMPDLMATCFQ